LNPASSLPGSFRSVVCGVDATRENLEAVRQAARIAAPDGRLTLVSVVVESIFEPEAAQRALMRAAHEVRLPQEIEASLLVGHPPQLLLQEIGRAAASLAAVGIHQASRAGGILLGGTAADVLFRAPCSVLVARPPVFPGRFPSRIVVGVDGSPHSLVALEVAKNLRDRWDCALSAVAADSGKGIAIAGPECAHVAIKPGAPVTVLVDAAQDADLLVVGHRGLHGVRSLGSVGERVAYRAACSVLVVRSLTA
jgi:nucleotide-binding universal stress UspA family protein